MFDSNSRYTAMTASTNADSWPSDSVEPHDGLLTCHYQSRDLVIVDVVDVTVDSS